MERDILHSPGNFPGQGAVSKIAHVLLFSSALVAEPAARTLSRTGRRHFFCALLLCHTTFMAEPQIFSHPSPEFQCAVFFWPGLFLLLCTGCGTHPEAALPQRLNPNLRVTLHTIPVQPRQLDPTTFTVRLVDASGKPIRNAGVHLNLAMPSMDMGKNEVVLKSAGPGVYTGTGRFTMAGAWQATVIEPHGSLAARQDFPIEVQ